MRPRTAGALCAALAGLALAFPLPAPPRPSTWPGRCRPPPPRDAPGLPPLPEASARNASYTIEARLDPEKRTLAGVLVLEWRNTSDQALSTFPFHLYWNAFRNNLSTTARGEGRRAPDDRKREERTFGWTRVTRVQLLGSSEPNSTIQDLTPTLRYLSEDGNADDRTVMEVRTAQPVAPGDTRRFRIEWDALVPHGSVGRAGWVHDYHFISQWFPKIGVFSRGEWNCHPFHPWTEFFSDFGVYDVKLTLPMGFVVGATGRLESRIENTDGTQTLRFVQADVHDFAWVASRRLLERRSRFEEPGYPPVDVRLLVQPEHAHLSDRYLEAAKIALRTYGTWSAPYPYAQITVVDPAWGSASGGMEYPTLLTGGRLRVLPARAAEPGRRHHPRGRPPVLVRPRGEQRVRGSVARRGLQHLHDLEGHGPLPRSGGVGAPLLRRRLRARRPHRLAHRRAGGEDRAGQRPPARAARGRRGGRHGEEGLDLPRRGSYGLNSYGKPALVLQTLEGLLGEDTMVRVLRTYARRYRFAHPTTEDFIATVDEVTGQDWRWFFDQTFFSSNLCDYAVEVKTEPARTPAGWFEGRDGRLELQAPGRSDAESEGGGVGRFESRVTVVRHGEVLLPVELRVDLADGRSVAERWDGRDRWVRFRYEGARVVRAVVDPRRRIALDVDPSNNAWIEDEKPARRAATKWSARYLFWLQNLLELHAVMG